MKRMFARARDRRSSRAAPRRPLRWARRPRLEALEGHGLATRTASRLRLTAAGLARSDVVGPWLYSAAMRRRSAAYELE